MVFGFITHYELKFVNDRLNALYGFIVIICFPFLFLALAFMLKNIFLKILNFILFFSISGLYILGGVGILLILSEFSDTLKNGEDRTFVLVEEIVLEGFHYNLYQTNAAIGTEYTKLRKEKDLYFGLKAVKTLYTTDKLNRVSIKSLKSGEIELNMTPFDKPLGKETIIFEP